MFRLAQFAAVALLLVASALTAQDSKNTSDDTPAPTKAKGALPPNFKQLGLTEDQRQKVMKIHASYKSKMESLNEQLSQLKSEERSELLKVLSDTQRTKLREILTHETESTKTSTKIIPAETKKDSKTDDSTKKTEDKKKDEK